MPSESSATACTTYFLLGSSREVAVHLVCDALSPPATFSTLERVDEHLAEACRRWR